MNVEFQELYRKYLEIYWDGDINNALKLDYNAREAHQEVIDRDFEHEHYMAFYSFATERSIGFSGKVYKIFHFDEDDSRTVILEQVYIVKEGTNELTFEFAGRVAYPAGVPIPCQPGGTYSFHGRIGSASMEWDLFYAGTPGGAMHSGLKERVPFLVLNIVLEDATCVSSSEAEYTGRTFGLPGGERFLWSQSASDRKILEAPVYRVDERVSQSVASTSESGGPTSNAAKSGCFVATAAYGSPLAAEVVLLSRYRDEVLLQNKLGALFVSFYYQVSPPLASLIAREEILRAATRSLFLAPLLRLLKRKLSRTNELED